MLDALRDFVRRLSAEEERHLGADDTRLALAALLVHCTAVDGVVSETERETLRGVLIRNFTLSDTDLDTLIADATALEREAVDLYRFTSVLKRQLSEDERIAAVEHLWEIVYADGKSHEFEENLVWRVAELMGVSRRDRIASKLAVAENKRADSPESG
ncbi:MAG: TerB family tellurite resistance protein [Propylenella sp.]